MNKYILLLSIAFFSGHGVAVVATEGSGAYDSPPVWKIEPGSGDASDDDLGKSLKSHDDIQKWKVEAGRAVTEGSSDSTVVIFPSGFEKIETLANRYLEKKQECVDKHATAAKWCLENLSPHILDGVTILNTIASTIGDAAVKDKCDKFAGAMDAAKGVMTAYTSACGLAKWRCGSTCGEVQEAIAGLTKEIPKSLDLKCDPVPNPQTQAQGQSKCTELKAKYKGALEKILAAAKEEEDKSKRISIAGKTSLCTEKYAQLLSSAVSGIGSLAKSMMEGKDCSDKTKGDTTQPQLANLNLVEKCKDPKNATLPECICEANPRTPGCANALQKHGENTNGVNQLSAIGGDKSNGKGTGRGVAGLDSDSGLPQIDHRDINPDGGGAAGAPVGGGSAGLGGGGGSGGGPGSGNGESQGNGLDLDKYGTGFMGGGGGAGRYGGGDGSGSGSGKYRAYLPGGAKDPSKGMVGQQAWRNEVTGQGGKSNFEKVKERYRDNKNTLLNN